MKDCKQLQQSSKPTLSKPVQHSKPNQADVTEFYLKCSSSQTLPIFMSLEDKPYCESFVQSSAHLPIQFQSICDPTHLNLNYLELVEASEKMSALFDLTETQRSHLEELTRGQATSKLWMRFQAGKITASRLYQVVRSDPHKPSVSLTKAICYPEAVKFATKSTSYGCKHEKITID